jgi:hypothetical protein
MCGALFFWVRPFVLRALKYSRICTCCLDKLLSESRIEQIFLSRSDRYWNRILRPHNRVSQTCWIRSEKCATIIDFGIEVERRIQFGAAKRQKGPTGGEFWTISERYSTIWVPVGKSSATSGDALKALYGKWSPKLSSTGANALRWCP